MRAARIDEAQYAGEGKHLRQGRMGGPWRRYSGISDSGTGYPFVSVVPMRLLLHAAGSPVRWFPSRRWRLFVDAAADEDVPGFGHVGRFGLDLLGRRIGPVVIHPALARAIHGGDKFLGE